MTILNVCAYTFDVADSYGRIAAELADGLATLETRVNRIDLNAEGVSPLAPSLGGIILGYPTQHRAYGYMVNAGPKLAVTMFESTRIPAAWIEPLNQCAAVIVPSAWLVDVFRESGVRVPIYCVPLGISRDFANVKPREHEPFTFLVHADRDQRKGWHRGMYAFNEAFGHDMRYRLLIKGRNVQMRVRNPNMEIISGDLSNAELTRLYHRAHVMLFPSSGEGFGLPPREFAATGGLVITTNWGGTSDDLDQWGLPLPYELTDAWDYKPEWHGVMGQWAEPDQDALVDLMRHVAQHYDAYRNFGLRAAGYVQTHYRWSTFAKRVYGIWSQIAGVGDHARVNGRKELLQA